jgi:hypothetical protein
MRKLLLTIAVVAAPWMLVLAATGCEEKVVTVSESEQRHESEPEMSSPGEEVPE